MEKRYTRTIEMRGASIWSYESINQTQAVLNLSPWQKCQGRKIAALCASKNVILEATKVSVPGLPVIFVPV
jgi:hypothetical protein